MIDRFSSFLLSRLILAFCLCLTSFALGQTIVVDFDDASSLRNSFNIWSTGTGDTSFLHEDGIGVGGGGGLRPVITSYYRGDKATLRGNSFDLTSIGTTVEMSLYFQYSDSLNLVPDNDGKFLVGLGLVPDSNVFMRDAVQGDDSADLRIGLAVSRGELLLAHGWNSGYGGISLSDGLSEDTWYRLDVEFERREVIFNGSLQQRVQQSASLQDYGADGLTAGTILAEFDDRFITDAFTPSIFLDSSVFTSLRITKDGGIVAIDAFTLVPEPNVLGVITVGLCIMMIVGRRLPLGVGHSR